MTNVSKILYVYLRVLMTVSSVVFPMSPVFVSKYSVSFHLCVRSLLISSLLVYFYYLKKSILYNNDFICACFDGSVYVVCNASMCMVSSVFLWGNLYLCNCVYMCVYIWMQVCVYLVTLKCVVTCTSKIVLVPFTWDCVCIFVVFIFIYVSMLSQYTCVQM